MRPTSPWYRKSKKKWYVEIRGKQEPPGRHPDGAPEPRKGKNGAWVRLYGTWHQTAVK